MNNHADLVLTNGTIWSDGLHEFASTLSIRDGRIVHVGSHDGAPIGPGTQVIDLQSRTVIPGLIDCHVHFLWGGIFLTAAVDLRAATSRASFTEILTQWIAKTDQTAGEVGDPQNHKWITGGRWSTESWADTSLPHKDWVDPATGDRPLFLYRMDGHSGLANSAALRIAGISKDGPENPAGGLIDRDSITGEPTGILRESAIELVTSKIPKPTQNEQIAACRAASHLALSFGITAVGDIVEPDTLETYRILADEARINTSSCIRLYMYLSGKNWEETAQLADQFPGTPHQVQIAGLKDYLDGSLGSRTAYMREPYEQLTNRGLLMDGIEAGRLIENLTIAKNRSYQPILHAIGDEANHLLLNALHKVYGSADAIRGAKPRSEHTQHLLPEDIKRFASLGVIASMQPYHKYDDAQYVESLIGKERCLSSYAWKSLLEAGAHVAFGSDWPIVTMNPFAAIRTAVTGYCTDAQLWQTQQNLSITEAFRCYTSRAAYALGAENEIGYLLPGYRADCVILDQSPFDADIRWEKLRASVVLKDGQVVCGQFEI